MGVPRPTVPERSALGSAAKNIPDRDLTKGIELSKRWTLGQVFGGNKEKMNTRNICRLSVLLCCLSLAGGYILLPGAPSRANPAGQEELKLDVPYEPSSGEIVQIMLEMARVGPDDVVYDLGCGDGRIVIAASQKTGARGVGVDLDPERVRESRENARKANVAGRVEFFLQDLFRTEISRATVVMLYLYPEVNLKLRPKLLRELTPGTRVVSHSHDMGEWEPDETRTASNGHRIHFWVIPANLTGTWEWDLPGEKERYAIRLSQQFQRISGTLQIGASAIPIENPTLRGSRVQFTVERPGKGEGRTWRFSGQARGHLLEGTIEGMGSKGNQTWKAARDSSSMKPLD